MSLRRGRVTSSAFITLLLLAASLLPLTFSGRVARAAVLYDSGDPTPAEQLVLEYINRARSNPVAEGQRLGIDIHEGLSDPTLVGPRPPLAMNKILLSIAEAHSQNMYTQNYYSHNDPNGDTPFDRMINAGYNYWSAGENMAGGVGVSATFLQDLLMVDAGTAGRLHRVNMLDFFNAYPCGSPPCVYYEVGIGYYQGAGPNGIGLSSLITQDFGTSNAGPFLLGVVYNDLNHNNFYDIGEGIAGVTIAPNSGSYYAVTSTSGGYTIPTGTSGTVTLTATGPGFGPTSKTVSLNGANVKVDFTTSDQTGTTTQTGTTSSTLVTTTQAQTTSTISTQTTTAGTNLPFIMLNPLFAPPATTVAVTGSQFSSSDTACFLSGTPVTASSCAISAGILTASFVVANVPVASYVVLATGNPTGDSASIIFTVTAPATQTTSATSTSTNATSSQTTQTTTVSLYTIGGSTSSQENNLTTSTSTQTSISSTSTSTQPVAPDFLVSASSNAIDLAQSSTGTLAISVQSIGTFDQQVQLQALGLPEGVEASFSPNPVNPSVGGTTSSTATLIVTRAVPTGNYQFEVVATSGSVSKDLTLSLRVSGCLIATATFGSELALEVQFLRDFRDNKILQTFAGTSFMVAFNTWYYSFSPTVAQYEAINPAMRSAVKVMIYPLIWILQIGSIVFDLFSFNQEAAAIFSGIIISALIGATYLAVPILILRRALLARTLRQTRMFGDARLFVFLGGLLLAAFGEVLRVELIMTIGSSMVVLSTIAMSALWTSRLYTTPFSRLIRHSTSLAQH